MHIYAVVIERHIIMLWFLFHSLTEKVRPSVQIWRGRAGAGYDVW